MFDVVYVVLKNADMIEGRGPMLLHSVWSNEKQPKLFIHNKNNYDGLYEIKQMSVYDSIVQMNAIEESNLRARALAKLTPEEMAALGLKE